MQSKCWSQILIASVWLTATAWGGTFGRVVALGGHGSDLALDEGRGVVYVADFTGSQIDVISTAELSRRSSMAVAAQPNSLALSHDGRYLLVTHHASFLPPNTAFLGMTLIQLDSGARQTFILPAPPLGAAFISDNRALIVTTTEFLLYNPATGALSLLATVGELTARTLPV